MSKNERAEEKKTKQGGGGKEGKAVPHAKTLTFQS
jgi:hypothetical protein